MDKNREGRRGGAISNRHVSAPRRSRASGIKYSSVNNEEEDETVENDMNSYSKGQERSKKFSGRVSPCLQDSDSHKDSDRPLHKKRRVGSPLDHAIGKDRGYGSDDPEIGKSDEEYDGLAPPSLSTRPWELKPHLKGREELSPIDPIIIPRKTRTAMTKRQQDSSHRNHLFDVSKQHGPSNAMRAFAQTCSNINSNHVRKKKLDIHKPSTSKSAKTLSTRISKTEVEVAKTLFDLARMFTAHYSASDVKSEALQPSKSGPANSATRSDVKPSPGVSSIDGGSQSSTPAIKNKRHQKHSKVKEEVKDEESTQAPSPEPTASEHAVCSHSDRVGCVSGSRAASPDINTDSNNPMIPDGEALITDASSPVSGEVRSVPDTVFSSVIASRVNDVLEKTISNDNASNVDLAGRSPLESAERCKINIDLMTLPKDIVKSDDTFNAGLADANGDGKTHLYNSNLEGAAKPTVSECKKSEKQSVLGLGVDLPAEGVENMEIDKDKRDLSEWSRENEGVKWTSEKANAYIEKSSKTDDLNELGKKDLVGNSGTEANKNIRNDPSAQRTDKTDTVTPLKSTIGSSISQLPVSVGLGSWSGFPLSYYSPMAAAAAAMAASWLKPVPMAGIASNESSVSALQLPSFFMPPRQPRKRCATHVYITHFIDWQEQLKSNPLWTAAYANSPWNRLKEKGLADGVLAGSKVHGSMEREDKAYMETGESKVNTLQKNEGTKKKMNGPVMGLPINFSAPASTSESCATEATPLNGLVSAPMLSSGSSTSASGAGNGILDGSVANPAVLQAQLLNSVIQQPPFPFPIASAHFGSAYNGQLLPQQVPPIFQGPFYDMNAMSQQLSGTKSVIAGQKQTKSSQGGNLPSWSTQLQPSGTASQPENCPLIQRNPYPQNLSSMQVGSSNYHSASLAASMPGMYSQDFSFTNTWGAKQTGKTKQQTQTSIQSQQKAAPHAQKQLKPYLSSQYHMAGASLQSDLKGLDPKTSPISTQVGFPCNASTGMTQGQVFDETEGHAPSPKSPQNQTVPGQAQQSGKISSQEHKHQQQQALAIADGCIVTNDRGIYAKIGHADNHMKSPQNDSAKSNTLKCEWETSQFMNGQHSNSESKAIAPKTPAMLALSESMVSHVSALGKLSTDQGSPYASHNALIGTQGLRFVPATQDSSQLSNTIALPASLLPEISTNSTQYLPGAVSKTQGQETRSEPSSSSGASVQSNMAIACISSSLVTNNMISLPSVPKSPLNGVTKASGSTKNPHISPPNSAEVSASLKTPTTNIASFIGSGQSSNTLQTQINQNLYNVQLNMRAYQHMRLVDSQQHGQTLPQNYLNYSNNLQKQGLPQQYHIPPWQHSLIPQPLQHEGNVQSPQQVYHRQKSSQQSQHVSAQQFTSMQPQNGSQVSPAVPTSFGSSVGSTSHNLSKLGVGPSTAPVSDAASSQSKSPEVDLPNAAVKNISSNFSSAATLQCSSPASICPLDCGTAELLGKNAKK